MSLQNPRNVNGRMILRLNTYLLLLVLIPLSLDATKGVDVSGFLYNYDFKDFMEAGIDGFAIFQGYTSNGTVNQYAINDCTGAHEAGFNNFDVYLSPCPKCNKTTSQQVQEMVKALKTMSYGHIWLDIEERSGNWFEDQKSNQRYFEELLTETQKYKPAGVYTNLLDWEALMGEEYKGGMSLPLWYVHHDGSPSFKDFNPFGGWTEPAIKQYDEEKRGHFDYSQ